MPLKWTPWSLIVFHDQWISDAIQFDSAAAWLIMFAAYIALYIALAVVISVCRPARPRHRALPYRAEWLWPDRCQSYLLPNVLVGTVAILSAVIAYRAPALQSLAVVLAAPPLAFSLLYLSMHRRRTARPWQRVMASAVAATTGLILLMVSGWLPALYSTVALGGGLCAASVPLQKTADPAPLRGRAEWRFRLGYVTMLFGMLVICAMLPAAVLFRDAYSQTTEVYAKYLQWRYAASLLARESRIKREMRSEHSDEPAEVQEAALEKRLSERRDFYGFLDELGKPRGSVSTAEGESLSAESFGGGLAWFMNCHELDAGPCQDWLKALQRHLSAALLWLIPTHNFAADQFPEFVFDRASDDSWKWRRHGAELNFVDEWGRVDRQLELLGEPTPLTTSLRSLPSALAIVSRPGVLFAAVLATLFGFYLLWIITRELFLLTADAPGAGVLRDPPQQAADPANGSDSAARAGVAQRTAEQTWAPCSKQEKLALLQLAQEGYLNPRNTAGTLRLLQQRIILRTPAFRLPEALRASILDAADRESILALEHQGDTSSWSKLRAPLLTLVVFAAAFIFATQRGLFDSTTGLITTFGATMTATAPVVMRFVSIWRNPQTVASATPTSSESGSA
jgi:hypothetical protein